MSRRRSNRDHDAPADEPKADGEQPKPEPADERRTVEDLAAALKTPPWAFAAAKQMHGWAIGALRTEGQFQAEVHAAMTVPMSSPSIRTRKLTRRKG